MTVVFSSVLGSGLAVAADTTPAQQLSHWSAQAFTDTAKVNKWFRRNCKDVLSRECSAGEKADVLAYLLNLKP